MLKLDTLYKRTKTGAIQKWHIEVRALLSVGEITTIHGQVDGKMQQDRETIFTGKNIGRANETTAFQQAEAEALSRWEKKVKAGYVQDIEKAAKDQNELPGIAPMLAHSYDDHFDKIKFPCLVQPKIDGNRCIAIVEGGRAQLFSRTRKPITSMPHIVAELELAFPQGRYVLDGELYAHSLRNDFEKIQSLVRTQKAQKNHGTIQYWVYDMAAPGIDFGTRMDGLHSIFKRYDFECCKLLVTYCIQNNEELNRYHDLFVDEGYEGAIVRNMEGLYQHNRSYDLQKVKVFKDAEFIVSGVHEGRGRMAALAIFDCLMDDGSGRTFGAKMEGKLDNLKRYLECPEQIIGKQITVKFQNRYRTGIPRFPVAWRIRESE